MGTRSVPIDLELIDSDPLLTSHVEASGNRLAPGFDAWLRRTRGTFTMACLTFMIPWALAMAIMAGDLVIGADGLAARVARGLRHGARHAWLPSPPAAG